MIPVKLKWEANLIDFDELAAALAEDVAAAAIEKSAKKLKATIQAYTPSVTGKLRRSIDYTIGIIPEAHIAYGVVGPRSRSQGNRYAHLVEFGHVAVAPRKGKTRRKGNARDISYVAARPFIRPAAEIFAAYAGTDLASGVENALGVKVTAMQRKKRVTVS